MSVWFRLSEELITVDIQYVPASILGIITAIIAGFLPLKYPAWDSKKKDIIGHPARPRHERWFYAWIIGLLILGGCWSILLPLTLNEDITKFQIFGIQYIPAIILTVITLITVIILFLIYPAWDSKEEDSNGHPNKPRHEKWFYIWLIGLSTLGGFWALFLPLALNQKFEGVNADGNQLRLHLLYITGGVLALTTLGETHRKNTLEKHKNDQDHTRQVHAERRSRYITAIEQLSNSDSATTRLGGVYSLVGLVDEWLADKKTIPNIKERRKKGQVIINNLCGYIRSPFPLAVRAGILDLSYEEHAKGRREEQDDLGYSEQEFTKYLRDFERDKSALIEERQVRSTIIQEISERLQNDDKPGPWSKFDYNFSNAPFFYFISFKFSHFDSLLKFNRATFTQGVDFSGATFTQGVDFSEATFQTEPIFESALANKARFSYKVKPENYNFNVSSKSPYKIDTEPQELNGVTLRIPEGATLFDPDDPSEQEDNDGS